MRALVLLCALALSTGCPGESQKTGAGATAPAQRTADAERRQAQTRLDELSEAKDAEAEALAAQSLRTWLSQPRQWRAEGYRVRLRASTEAKAPPAPPLTRAQVEALIAAKAPVRLALEVPYFPPTVPQATRAFLDPAALTPLLPVLHTSDE